MTTRITIQFADVGGEDAGVAGEEDGGLRPQREPPP
jgi:hypothetical protein